MIRESDIGSQFSFVKTFKFRALRLPCLHLTQAQVAG
jgi:hypothetical protein